MEMEECEERAQPNYGLGRVIWRQMKGKLADEKISCPRRNE